MWQRLSVISVLSLFVGGVPPLAAGQVSPDSMALLRRTSLPGNGNGRTEFVVALHDPQGNRLRRGGASVVIRHAPGSAGLSRIGPVHDNSTGRYTATITAGLGAGFDVFSVEVDDGSSAPVRLTPAPRLELRPTLTTRSLSLSSAAGGVIDLDLEGPFAPSGGEREYLVLASASGTAPGFSLGGVRVALRPDGITAMSILAANGRSFRDTRGLLGTDGRGAASLVARPDQLRPLIGRELSFLFITLGPIDFASNPTVVPITP